MKKADCIRFWQKALPHLPDVEIARIANCDPVYVRVVRNRDAGSLAAKGWVARNRERVNEHQRQAYARKKLAKQIARRADQLGVYYAHETSV